MRPGSKVGRTALAVERTPAEQTTLDLMELAENAF